MASKLVWVGASVLALALVLLILQAEVLSMGGNPIPEPPTPQWASPSGKKIQTPLDLQPEESAQDIDTSYFLVAGIVSQNERRSLRDTIRKTWIHFLDNTPMEKKFMYKFVLANSLNPETQASIEEERSKYNDVIIAPCIDNYRNLSDKTLYLAQWATDNHQFTYLFKVDDDSFVRLDRVVEFMKDKPRRKVYMGREMGPYVPHRDPASQWYVSKEEYPLDNSGTTLVSGPGYLLSYDVAVYMAARSRAPGYKRVWLEDVNTMILANEMGATSVDIPTFHRFQHCDEQMMLAHYTPEAKYEVYYQRSLQRKPMCR